MNKIYQALGIEKLMSDAVLLEELTQYVVNNPIYVIPGYMSDYYQYAFNRELEFDVCKRLDNDDRGIAVHVCGRNELDLTFYEVISEKDSAHIYRMGSKVNCDSFPMQVVCPDVLAGPKAGDLIHGQIVAIAGNVTSVLSEDEVERLSIQDIGDYCVSIIGRISGIREYTFSFSEIKAEYWDMNYETDIGTITLVIRKDLIDFIPESGQILVTDAILSFDPAINPLEYAKDPFYIDYHGASFTGDHQYGCGFIPNQTHAEFVLINSIEKKDLLRFQRACEDYVEIHQGNVREKVENQNISKYLSAYFAGRTYTCEMVQIVDCDNPLYFGKKAISARKDDNLIVLLFVGTSDYGFVNALHFIEPVTCKTGSDYELYVLSVLAQAMFCSKTKPMFTPLHKMLSEKCFYRSEYAENITVGANKIIDRLISIANSITYFNKYTFEILHSSEILKEATALPDIYSGKWCIKAYQASELAFFIFVQMDLHGRICNILLSRNGNYIKDFEAANSSAAIIGNEPVNVKHLLEKVYGKNNTVSKMREDNRYYEDTYVWKQTDTYAIMMLHKGKYNITTVAIEPDCIAYACNRKGKEYAVYFYAYGKQKMISLDGDYCERLRNYSLSENRTILVVSVHVKKTEGEDGVVKYHVQKSNVSESEPDFWLLDQVGEKSILRVYSRDEIEVLTSRMIAAFNTQNLDVLKALYTNVLPYGGEKNYREMHNFYSYLSNVFRNHGKMRVAFIRQYDSVFTKVPYITNVAYYYFHYSYSMRDGIDHICGIEEKSLDGEYSDFLISADIPEIESAYVFPSLTDIEFLPSRKKTSSFAVSLYFDNGEQRRYRFKFDECSINRTNPDQMDSRIDVVGIDDYSFTLKILTHGKIVEHIDLPDTNGYSAYPQRGQGIAFANGYAISTAELYYNSCLVKK